MSKVRTPEPELFDAFWAVWRPHMRHTDGRGDARERYRKELLGGADPAEILEGAKAYIKRLGQMPPDERKFIPLAATWLHKQSYTDWAEQERDLQRRLAEAEARRNARENVVSLRSA